ncbi:EamA family transporter [Nocardioides mangrovi]|uniref:EamA family transporter n=1 Tax=Nocardioides mangrovi TaxID=2874580 RepID=A0ABS7UBM0_9ACTN|nr:EamA family transporter [Nocardioides mangrovi]MBZ5738399.1 EamA family transporter [Nocardioides mangrovi]
MPPLAPETSRTTLLAALVTVWVLWGSVYLAIRIVVDEVDPFQAMAQRFAAAALILAAIVVVRRGARGLRVSRREVGALVATGVLLVGLGNGLQALAQVRGLPSGVAALVVATVPAWAVLLRVATGERPSSMTLAGVAVGFLGLAVLVLLGHGVGEALPIGAVLLCLGSSISWTLGSFLAGTLALPDDLFVVATYQQLVAACCSSLLAFGHGERFSVDYSVGGWAALAYLVVACSIVSFVAFAWLLTHVPLSLTATHAYVNPVVAVLLGWAILAEPLGAPVLVGGGIVVSAVVLIVTAERRPSDPLSEGAPVTAITPVGEANAPSEGRNYRIVRPQSLPRAGTDEPCRSHE